MDTAIKLEANIEALRELRGRLSDLDVRADEPRLLDSAVELLDAAFGERVKSGAGVLALTLNLATAGVQLATAMCEVAQEKGVVMVVVHPSTGDPLGTVDGSMSPPDVVRILHLPHEYRWLT